MTTTATRTVVTSQRRSDTIESPYSDSEAADKCRATGKEFARKMADSWSRWGDRLSVEQRYWLHKLAVEADRPQASDAEHVQDGAYEAVSNLFATAKQNGLRYPKLHVEHFGEQYKISQAGPRSRTPGAINVTSEGGFSDATWYGRMQGDTFSPARNISGEQVTAIVSMLRELADDPVKFATTHGHTTGACCFCGQTLTHESSIAVGYGPVCAARWGLPHSYSPSQAEIMATATS